jgi:phage-related protein
MMGNVLPFRSQASATTFRLREVVKGNKGEMTGWFESNRGARAKFRIRVGHLQKVPRAEWNVTQFRKLEDGLYEIKWKFADKQFRAIGFDHEGWFVMLLGCTHKMSVYDPSQCLSTAKRMKKEVQNGEWKTIAFEA